MSINKKRFNILARNFIFGVEDSLVSTVGVISGVAVAGMPKITILVTGIVLIFVEAFSMGAGSFISEHSAQEYAKKKNNDRQTALAAFVMFISYFIAGIVPIFPYLLMDIELAFWVSISASILGLGLLGIINSKIYNTRTLHHALEMLVIGGVAIGVGTLVGKLADILMR